MTLQNETTELKRAMLSCLTPHKRVSFVELERVLTPEYEIIGDAAMSNLWIRALSESLTEQKIRFHITDMLTYFQAGRALDLPIARSFERSYETWHWMPVTISRIGT